MIGKCSDSVYVSRETIHILSKNNYIWSLKFEPKTKQTAKHSQPQESIDKITQ